MSHVLRTVFLGAIVAVLACPPCAAEVSVSPERLLTTGPLPLQAPDDAAVAFVPELDPAAIWPEAGQSWSWGPGARASWSARSVQDGRLAMPAVEGDSVEWLAVYVVADRRASWTVRYEGPGTVRCWMDGDEGCAKDAVTLAHGLHRVLLRIAREAGPATESGLTFASDVTQAGLETRTDPRHPVTDYDELRHAATPESLALSPDGELLAYVLSRRDPDGEDGLRALRLVRTDDGREIVPTLGGASAAPVGWRDDSGVLYFRDGNSLFAWDRARGAVSRILGDEPGLGAIDVSRDGKFVVFASTRGVEEPSTDHRRRVALREKLADWPTAPHLSLLMIDSGVRRRLTAPGDYAQDAFEILPDGRTLLYLRNLPMAERPWFFTEFRRRDLVSGDDRMVASVVMGFENRPGLAGMAVSPDGRKLAFVGPPSELGRLADKEHNAFDPDLFVLHLDDGSWYRLTDGFDPAVVGSVTWAADSRSVSFQATDGSRHRIVTMTLRDDDLAPTAKATDPGGERVHALSLNARGQFAAVVSDTDRLPQLVFGKASAGTPRTLLDPNAEWQERWRLAAPEDASFTGPDGRTIEGWLYRPVNRPSGAEERLPLIVYYYGGATPTLRGFNEFHQFFVGNGYAMFVLNPRGANGYGEAFADLHVAEQGTLAAADVLAGVDAVLAANADLDPDRIGCYGGSYGGFMTMTLVSRSERFAAAVSLYGISNVASYWGDGMWGYTYGDQAINHYPWEDPQFFVDRSPLFHADRVRTPLLLMHGDDDGNVPPGESEQMFTALRLLDRPVELVRFAGEDHGMRGTWENRVAHRTMMLEWFDRWLRDRPEGWNDRWER